MAAARRNMLRPTGGGRTVVVAPDAHLVMVWMRGVMVAVLSRSVGVLMRLMLSVRRRRVVVAAPMGRFCTVTGAVTVMRLLMLRLVRRRRVSLSSASARRRIRRIRFRCRRRRRKSRGVRGSRVLLIAVCRGGGDGGVESKLTLTVAVDRRGRRRDRRSSHGREM